MEDLILHFSSIEESLDYQFKNKKLLIQAFTHRSFLHENRLLLGENNERLEFLGDAILGFLVSDYLYNHLPSLPEGELSRLRAAVVETSNCAKFLLKWQLDPFVLLGKGERMNQGKGRESILADLFEALIGAIYIDGGVDEIKRVFWLHFEEEVLKILENPTRNWKAELQEYSQKNYQKSPVYKTIEETGPDHNRTFLIAVYLSDQEAGRGKGASKKEAEQEAAKNALKGRDDKG